MIPEKAQRRGRQEQEQSRDRIDHPEKHADERQPDAEHCEKQITPPLHPPYPMRMRLKIRISKSETIRITESSKKSKREKRPFRTLLVDISNLFRVPALRISNFIWT